MNKSSNVYAGFNPYRELVKETPEGMIGMLDRISGVTDLNRSDLMSLFSENKLDCAYNIWEEMNGKLFASEVPKMAILQAGFDDAGKYEIVYNRIQETPYSDEMPSACENIFAEFNADCLRPADYYGYSLSVGDVVVFANKYNDMKSFKVRSIGFEEISVSPDEELKRKIAAGFDIRKEMTVLEVLSNMFTLPAAYRIRLDEIQNEFSRVFELADKRNEIFKVRETDPLYGEFPDFALDNFEKSSIYFAIGKMNENEEDYSIFSLYPSSPFSNIQVSQKGFKDVNSAVDYIDDVIKNSDKEIVLVTMADLKNIEELVGKNKRLGLRIDAASIKAKEYADKNASPTLSVFDKEK